MGRSDVFLKLEIIKKAVGLALLGSSMWFGVMAMAWTLPISSIVGQIVNSWPNKKLLGYSYLDQFKDMFPSIVVTLLMGATVFSIQFLNLNTWITLLIQVPVGAIIYVALSAIFKLESFTYILNVAKKFIKKKNKRDEAANESN